MINLKPGELYRVAIGLLAIYPSKRAATRNLLYNMAVVFDVGTLFTVLETACRGKFVKVLVVGAHGSSGWIISSAPDGKYLLITAPSSNSDKTP